MIAQHFCERFPEEQFLIFDETHHMALVYRPYDFAILPLEELIVPKASADEFFIGRSGKCSTTPSRCRGGAITNAV